jgi:iron complex outermembrane recepter protein
MAILGGTRLVAIICPRQQVGHARLCQARQRWVVSVCFLWICCLRPAAAQQAPADLTQMSLEDLLSVQVTTAGKKEQKLGQTAAAVYVITAEEIERSGLTSIPEVLRLAPGVAVAQVNSSVWAISIRGFNSRYSDKLLVLVDGLTVYSATFSQVLWNVQDLPLDDVERIEVIRGPGASVWGANAVDGVINIITRNANETQGGLLSVTAGTHDSTLAGLRYGWRAGSNAAFRVSAQYINESSLTEFSGGSNHDHWDLDRASARTDWSPSGQNHFLFEGNLYQSGAAETREQAILEPPFDQITNGPSIYSGGDLLVRWKHESAGGSETVLQAFYDRSHQQYPEIGATEDTFDLDFLHRIHLGNRHDLVWGLGARAVNLQTRGTFSTAFYPPATTIKLFSGFLQDEVALLAGRLRLTLGTKLEHNDYSGAEIQPDIRLLWQVRSQHTLWMAVSRAVRSPSILEEGAQVNALAFPGPGGLPVVTAVVGHAGLDSEKLVAYEAGYRAQPASFLSLDLATFYNRYDKLSSGTPGDPVLENSANGPYFLLPIVLGNGSRADGAGLEIAATYNLQKVWQFSGSYSWLRLRYQQVPGEPSDIESFSAGATPQHQFQIHSYLALLHQLQFDTSLYFVGRLAEQAGAVTLEEQSVVPRYTRLDVHLGWLLKENVSLSAGLQNLLSPRHLEFGEDIVPMVPTEAGRSCYGKVAWRF